MFERVLVATDFSEHAYNTLECVLGIKEMQEVVLLHVIDATRPRKMGWVFNPAIKNAEIELENQIKHLLNHGIRGRVRLEVITSGGVAETIVSAAKEEGASLIIMGSRGRGLIQSVLLGSVSKAVLHRTMAHILIMRHRIMESMNGKKYKFHQSLFSKILFPTDFSRPAYAVVPLLKDLKGLEKVILLHVITRGETRQEIDTYVKDARIRLEAIGTELRSAGKKAEVSVRLGSPTSEINFLAEERDVSLIVMGRHGYGWMREILAGSTTDMVAKRTKRPLLVVQPGVWSRA
jgi:nucleotide-binding universal stress UspA family protein